MFALTSLGLVKAVAPQYLTFSCNQTLTTGEVYPALFWIDLEPNKAHIEIVLTEPLDDCWFAHKCALQQNISRLAKE